MSTHGTNTKQQTKYVVSIFRGDYGKSMEQCPAEAARSSVSQEIIRVAWKPRVHYRLHKNQPLVLNMSQMKYNSLKIISTVSSIYV